MSKYRFAVHRALANGVNGLGPKKPITARNQRRLDRKKAAKPSLKAVAEFYKP